MVSELIAQSKEGFCVLRLFFQGAHLSFKHFHNVPEPVHIDIGTFETAFGVALARTVFADPQSLFENSSSVFGLSGKNGVHSALPDDCISFVAQSGVTEKVEKIPEPDRFPVEQILAFA